MSAYLNALDNMQKRIEGKMSVCNMLINEFYPLTHRDFVVSRAPNHDHIYHVIRKDDNAWLQCKYEGRSLLFKSGTFQF